LKVNGTTRPRTQEQFKLSAQGDVFLGKIVAWSPQAGTLEWRPTLAKTTAVLSSLKDLRLDLSSNSAYFLGRKEYPHRILFTNNDCVGCRVSTITPDTVTFDEPFHGKKCQVASSDVKAIEFDPAAVERLVADARDAPVDAEQEKRNRQMGQRQHPRNFIDAERRETLLSLPRKYKGRPPTHLFIGTTGDVVRGALNSTTADSFTLKMSLSADSTLSREGVAAIVLFHPAPTATPAAAPEKPAAAPEKSPAGPEALTVEIALDKETRLTVELLAADAESITGRSPYVGEVHVPYQDIVSIVSGSLRGKARGFFTPWEMTPMKEPPM
jgi:hypothetical protein